MCSSDLNSGATGGTKTMTRQFKLNVATRAQTGRSSSRRLRKSNRVPAILYGKHTSPESLSIEGAEFIRLLKSVSGRAVLIELDRADKADKALSFLQEVQRDPITDKYLHIDLQEVNVFDSFVRTKYIQSFSLNTDRAGRRYLFSI